MEAVEKVMYVPLEGPDAARSYLKHHYHFNQKCVAKRNWLLMIGPARNVVPYKQSITWYGKNLEEELHMVKWLKFLDFI
jgi:hypothetical protein